MDPLSNVLDTVTRLIPTAVALAGVVIGLYLANRLLERGQLLSLIGILLSAAIALG
jgi:hypothetical protein